MTGPEHAPRTDGPAPSAPTRSGHPRVDEVLEALAGDSRLPPAEQIAGYDAAHRTLQETLASIDEGQS